ncbi:MAG: hypothetical protein JW713_05845 [Pontiellaceae bacterium]|nr:hypothetical protein [Pontiellaceae bacterium]
MITKSYSDLLDMIEPYMMGCPAPVIIQRLQLAGRDFCVQTERLVQTLTADAIKGQREYDLILPLYGSSIKRVEQVRLLSESDVKHDLDGMLLGRGYYQLEKKAGIADGKVVSTSLNGASDVYQQIGAETANGKPVYIDAYRDFALWMALPSGDPDPVATLPTVFAYFDNDDRSYEYDSMVNGKPKYVDEFSDVIQWDGSQWILHSGGALAATNSATGYFPPKEGWAWVAGAGSGVRLSYTRFYIDDDGMYLAHDHGGWVLAPWSGYETWGSSGTTPFSVFYLLNEENGPAGSFMPCGKYAGFCNIEASVPCVGMKLRDSIKPSKSIEGGIKVKVLLEPNKDTDHLPDWFLNEYGNAIVAGALWRLYSMPRQLWSSPRDAMEQRAVYLQYIADAKIDALLEEDGNALQMGIEGYTC